MPLRGEHYTEFCALYRPSEGPQLLSGEAVQYLPTTRGAELNDIALSVPARVPGPGIGRHIKDALQPLYSLFDFFVLPANLVTEELARMRSGRT